VKISNFWGNEFKLKLAGKITCNWRSLLPYYNWTR